jgi:hypothetical protein
VQPFERERLPGTVPDEALDAGAVLGFDAHGSVDAEPTGALPGEHACGVGLVEEVVAAEVAKDAGAERGLEPGTWSGVSSEASWNVTSPSLASPKTPSSTTRS